MGGRARRATALEPVSAPARLRSAEDPIHNWLSFPCETELVTGPNPLRVMARTDDPTVDAEMLAMARDLVLAVLRFYLAEPEPRRELRDSRAWTGFTAWSGSCRVPRRVRP